MQFKTNTGQVRATAFRSGTVVQEEESEDVDVRREVDKAFPGADGEHLLNAQLFVGGGGSRTIHATENT